MFKIILFTHILSIIAGFGAAISTDWLFVKFIKNLLTSNEQKTLHRLSSLIWTSLIFITISGLGLIYMKPSVLDREPFQLKILLFVIICFNGTILSSLSFKKLNKAIKNNSIFSKKHLLLTAISGSISITTWTSILFISITKLELLSIYKFLLIYLTTVIIGSFIAYKKLLKN